MLTIKFFSYSELDILFIQMHINNRFELICVNSSNLMPNLTLICMYDNANWRLIFKFDRKRFKNDSAVSRCTSKIDESILYVHSFCHSSATITDLVQSKQQVSVWTSFFFYFYYKYLLNLCNWIVVCVIFVDLIIFMLIKWPKQWRWTISKSAMWIPTRNT